MIVKVKDDELVGLSILFSKREPKDIATIPLNKKPKI